ncbi:MAG: stage V sporulation protein AC [Ruminococcaceae bacterium]|nr:stage V sporulation protein AC [Oscillospiraceae bacterium]
MATGKKEYSEMAKRATPNSPKLKNCVKAFLTGGTVCLIGQLLITIYGKLGFDTEEAKALETVTLIVLTAILTGIGIFDKIAKHAGAGTIVPITGFANSVVSPAVEFKPEGRITGTGVKIFSIAGPVIAYGTAAAFVYGIICFIFKLY